MTERTANNRLSLTASAIWRYRMAEPDPMGDPSGDCGDLIAAHERAVILRMVAEGGYERPGDYNRELRARMVGDGERESHNVWALLRTLEVEDVCEHCGAALDVRKHWTRQYGGGWNTMTVCPGCGWMEVGV